MKVTGRGIAFLPVFAVLSALVGCGGGAVLMSYIGGGLPPGEPDIGGVVLAVAPATAWVDTAAGETPVVGATVELYKGIHRVGQTLTGAGGYFRFEEPASGRYRLQVTPPVGSGLRAAQRDVDHQYGRQTFVEIVLQRD